MIPLGPLLQCYALSTLLREKVNRLFHLGVVDAQHGATGHHDHPRAIVELDGNVAPNGAECIRGVVHDAEARAGIWHRIFPESTPIEDFRLSIESKFRENLVKRGRVSKALREQFAKNGILLSKDAVIRSERKNTRWKITDNESTYIVKKAKDRLNIYSSRFDCKKLAQLNIVGGSIRNIAMNAAFLAADQNGPVRMEHLLQAAKMEYMKMEKSLTDNEIKGWT